MANSSAAELSLRLHLRYKDRYYLVFECISVSTCKISTIDPLPTPTISCGLPLQVCASSRGSRAQNLDPSFPVARLLLVHKLAQRTPLNCLLKDCGASATNIRLIFILFDPASVMRGLWYSASVDNWAIVSVSGPCTYPSVWDNPPCRLIPFFSYDSRNRHYKSNQIKSNTMGTRLPSIKVSNCKLSRTKKLHICLMAWVMKLRNLMTWLRFPPGPNPYGYRRPNTLSSGDA